MVHARLLHIHIYAHLRFCTSDQVLLVTNWHTPKRWSFSIPSKLLGIPATLTVSNDPKCHAIKIQSLTKLIFQISGLQCGMCGSCTSNYRSCMSHLPSLLQSIFQEQSCVSLHHDLQDCHVAVCSTHVPPIFADNFDYQTRLDFVRGILEHEEVSRSVMACRSVGRLLHGMLAELNKLSSQASTWT